MVAQSIPVLVKRQQKQNGKNNIGCTRRLYKINVQRNRNVKQKLQFIRLLGKCIIGIQLHAQRKCMRIFIKADARINQVISGSESDFKKFSEFKIG